MGTISLSPPGFFNTGLVCSVSSVFWLRWGEMGRDREEMGEDKPIGTLLSAPHWFNSLSSDSITARESMLSPPSPLVTPRITM